jgi:hypothetical protein
VVYRGVLYLGLTLLYFTYLSTLFLLQFCILSASSCLFQIAQRSLPFLHNCIKELEILEISAPPGAVACWVFLCCLEVLQNCERFNDSGQVEAYSLYTASLWAYARDKVRLINEPCVWVWVWDHFSVFAWKYNSGIIYLIVEIVLNQDIPRCACNGLS